MLQGRIEGMIIGDVGFLQLKPTVQSLAAAIDFDLCDNHSAHDATPYDE